MNSIFVKGLDKEVIFYIETLVESYLFTIGNTLLHLIKTNWLNQSFKFILESPLHINIIDSNGSAL